MARSSIDGNPHVVRCDLPGIRRRAQDGDPVPAIKRLTGGRGADVAIEALDGKTP